MGDVTCIRTSFEIKRGAYDGECIVLEVVIMERGRSASVLFVQIPLGIRAEDGLG